MALSSRAVRRLSCGSCRQWMLRSFIASIGGPSLLTRTPPFQHRTFTAATRTPNEARERIQIAEKDDFALNDINTDFARAPRSEVASEGAASSQPSDAAEPEVQSESAVNEGSEQRTETKSAAHVPWYLQVDSPVPVQHSAVSARQQIPKLPEFPPTLLEPLLQQVSVELGMDDLTLLDLRELDPSPALGANLFMLVGTARSERHLHVSADKLCRWLRTYHDLTPVADGLLGRQELKVKMRRRAKRARLMSAVGAKSTADTELEEGIRTGWVCVNVGRVEGGELPKSTEEQKAEKMVIGFGSRTSGSHLVVQLMTEDKRGELDLEKLWTGILTRSKLAKEELLKKDEEDAGAGMTDPGVSAISSDASSSGSSPSHNPAFAVEPGHPQSQIHPTA